MIASTEAPARPASLVASALGRLAPWGLTLVRLATAQTLLLANVEMMMAGPERLTTSLDPGWWARTVIGVASSGPGHVVAASCPVLLAAGLLPRPASALLLVEIALLHPARSSPHLVPLEALLLIAIVLLGPGALALDGLFGSGLTRSAVPGAAAIARFYQALRHLGEPVLLLTARLAIALAPFGVAAAAGHALGAGPTARPPAGTGGLWFVAVAVAVAASLAVGFAVRLLSLSLIVLLVLDGRPLVFVPPAATLPLLLLLILLLTRGGGGFALDRWLGDRLRRLDRRSGPLPRVVIVGAGFGGIATATSLRRSACQVTLIDRQNHHLFQPLLYQVATATLSPADIATPIRSFCRTQDNLSVLLGEVTGVDASARTVTLGERSVGYDVLVLATGARHSYLGHDAWMVSAPGLKTLADATSIRMRILAAFEAAEATDDEPSRLALLTFVIVGGGPTGVELAGAIADLAHLGLLAEYRVSRPERARVILVHSGDRLLPAFPTTLSSKAGRALQAAGVEILLSSRATAIDDRGVRVGDLEVAARTVIWAAGVKASPAAAWLGVAADKAGRVIVDDRLRAGNVFVVGDTSASRAWNGALVPGLASAAKQQGHYVARTIAAQLRGRKPPPPFRYRHYGDLATIGRKSAVAAFGPVRVSGGSAWWLWGGAHVAFLVGGRNRAAVLLAWLWSYLTLSPGTRLIIRSQHDGG